MERSKGRWGVNTHERLQSLVGANIAVADFLDTLSSSESNDWMSIKAMIGQASFMMKNDLFRFAASEYNQILDEINALKIKGKIT